MRKLKLAITDPSDGIALIRNQFDDVRPEFHIGMNTALKLVPATAILRSDDLNEWVTRILDHATEAPETEICGLVEALNCLLSLEERPAEELIDERRFPPSRARRIRRTFHRRKR